MPKLNESNIHGGEDNDSASTARSFVLVRVGQLQQPIRIEVTPNTLVQRVHIRGSSEQRPPKATVRDLRNRILREVNAALAEQETRALAGGGAAPSYLPFRNCRVLRRGVELQDSRPIEHGTFIADEHLTVLMTEREEKPSVEGKESEKAVTIREQPTSPAAAVANSSTSATSASANTSVSARGAFISFGRGSVASPVVATTSSTTLTTTSVREEPSRANSTFTAGPTIANTSTRRVEDVGSRNEDNNPNSNHSNNGRRVSPNVPLTPEQFADIVVRSAIMRRNGSTAPPSQEEADRLRQFVIASFPMPMRGTRSTTTTTTGEAGFSLSNERRDGDERGERTDSVLVAEANAPPGEEDQTRVASRRRRREASESRLPQPTRLVEDGVGRVGSAVEANRLRLRELIVDSSREPTWRFFVGVIIGLILHWPSLFLLLIYSTARKDEHRGVTGQYVRHRQGPSGKERKAAREQYVLAICRAVEEELQLRVRYQKEKREREEHAKGTSRAMMHLRCDHAVHGAHQNNTHNDEDVQGCHNACHNTCNSDAKDNKNYSAIIDMSHNNNSNNENNMREIERARSYNYQSCRPSSHTTARREWDDEEEDGATEVVAQSQINFGNNSYNSNNTSNQPTVHRTTTNQTQHGEQENGNGNPSPHPNTAAYALATPFFALRDTSTEQSTAMHDWAVSSGLLRFRIGIVIGVLVNFLVGLLTASTVNTLVSSTTY